MPHIQSSLQKKMSIFISFAFAEIILGIGLMFIIRAFVKNSFSVDIPTELTPQEFESVRTLLRCIPWVYFVKAFVFLALGLLIRNAGDSM